MAQIHIDIAGLYGGELSLDVAAGSTGGELVVVDRDGNKAQLSPDGAQMLRVAGMCAAFVAGTNHLPDLEETVDGYWDRLQPQHGEVQLSVAPHRGEFVLTADEKGGSTPARIALGVEQVTQLGQALAAGGYDL